jgi:hypothetical protein
MFCQPCLLLASSPYYGLVMSAVTFDAARAGTFWCQSHARLALLTTIRERR